MKFILILLLLLLTAGASKSARKPARPPPSGQPRSSLLEMLQEHPWYRRTALACAWVLGVATLVQTAIALQGSLWPDPVVHSRDTQDASSFVMPLTVENQSGFLSIKDARFTCGVQLFWLKNAEGQSFGGADIAFESERMSIPSRATINYDCDASKLVQMNPDGSMGIRDAFLTAPAGYPGSFRVWKMCLWVGIDYRIAGVWPTQFNSEIFQWPERVGGHQWLEGAANMDSFGAATPDDRAFNSRPFRCTDAPYAPYVWIKKGAPQPCLILGAREDQCRLFVTKMYNQATPGKGDMIAP